MNLARSEISETALAACDIIRRQSSLCPDIAIILGTGLGDFVEQLSVSLELPYSEIPGFCQPTSIGHQGRLLIGTIAKIPVLILQGRSHFYEGHGRDQIVFPVEVLAGLGIQSLVVSCAAGGLNPAFREGDLMLIDDHIDFLPKDDKDNLSGQPSKTRQVDTAKLKELVLSIARQQRIALHQGVYVAVPGPNYETRAEMRFFRRIADAIGMSTVPEATTAAQFEMQLVGLAAITNLCRPDSVTVADSDHVVDSAHAIEPRFRKLVVELIRRLDDFEK